MIPLPVACAFDSLFVNAAAVPASLGAEGPITVTLWVDTAPTSLLVNVDNTSGADLESQVGASIPANVGHTVARQVSGAGLLDGQEMISASLHRR